MYKYLIFDGSYILMKAFHAIKSGDYSYISIPLTDNNGNILYNEETKEMEVTYSYVFTQATITKAVYYQIAKLIREYFPCKKPIIVFDKSPYHRVKDLNDYKSDRHYYSEDDLEGIEETNYRLIHETKEEIRSESIKHEAKYWIANNFPELGIPVLMHKGYEGDDLAHLLAQQLELDGERSAIVSIDGDWSYLINPNVDHIKLFMRKEPIVISYEDMMTQISSDSPEGMSLYRYKSLLDSLYGSHNFLKYTANEKVDTFGDNIEIFDSIEHGEYEYVKDKELFDKQLKSFDISSFPELTEVKELLKSIESTQAPLESEQYRLFCNLTGFQVSESYYNRTIRSFDQNLYTNQGRSYM